MCVAMANLIPLSFLSDGTGNPFDGDGNGVACCREKWEMMGLPPT